VVGDFLAEIFQKNFAETTCPLRESLYIGRPWIAGWSSLVARQAHNLKAAGSNPAPATNFSCGLIKSFATPLDAYVPSGLTN
jgi:hypothetical protein